MESLKSYLEVEIIFKNGKKDWVSPIDNVNNDIIIDYDTGQLSIYNGYFTYDYIIDDIDSAYYVTIIDDEEAERSKVNLSIK